MKVLIWVIIWKISFSFLAIKSKISLMEGFGMMTIHKLHLG